MHVIHKTNTIFFQKSQWNGCAKSYLHATVTETHGEKSGKKDNGKIVRYRCLKVSS